MDFFYSLGVGLARVCFSTFARWEITGRESVPPRGRLLVVSNHLSYADPPVLGAALPRVVHFLGQDGLFDNPITAAVMKAWKVHPVDRSENDLRAALWAIRALNREETVGLFPEGRRNPAGMRMAHSGIAYIAARTQTPILPVGITGTENIPGYWRILLAFHKIRVNIGTPFTLPPIDGRLERGVRDSLTEMIMLRVAALLPKEYRGDYGAARSRMAS